MTHHSEIKTLVDRVAHEILTYQAGVSWSDATRDLYVEDDRSIHAAPQDPPFRLIVSPGVETFILGFASAQEAAHAFLQAIGPKAALELEFPEECVPPIPSGRTTDQDLPFASELMLTHLKRAAPRPKAPMSPLEIRIALALRDGMGLSWRTARGRPVEVHRSHRHSVDDDGTVTPSYSFSQGRWRRAEGNVRGFPTAEIAARHFVGMVGSARAEAALDHAIARLPPAIIPPRLTPS